MIKISTALTPLKKSRYHDTSPDLAQPVSSPRYKISPIPVIRKKLQNDRRIARRLQILGYKHFSKLSAAGSTTDLVLQYLKKSTHMKYIAKFEFDPYLCKESYVGSLNKALPKMRQSRKINLVFRRLEKLNETNLIACNFLRLLKLEQIRIEMPRTNNIDDEGLIKMAWMYGHCYNMKRGEHVLIGLDQISDFAHMHFAKYGRKLVQCREIKKIVQKTASFPQINDDENEKASKAIFKANPLRARCVREIHMTISVPQGWLSMSTDVDETPLNNMKLIANMPKLVNVGFCFSGNPITLETMQVLCETLPKYQSLKHFKLELRNSRVSETEIIQFAQTLPHLKSLEQLTFKVIQFPNVSEGGIFYLIGTISKLSNVKKFDIYFRRLDIAKEIVDEIVERVQFLNNVECIRSPHSLHFKRREKLTSPGEPAEAFENSKCLFSSK